MPRELVERARAGDHEAFGELARLVIARLYAVAFLILRDQAQAEDATQEALVAAWRDLSGLRDPDRFDAWIRKLLVRALRSRGTPAATGTDRRERDRDRRRGARSIDGACR